MKQVQRHSGWWMVGLIGLWVIGGAATVVAQPAARGFYEQATQPPRTLGSGPVFLGTGTRELSPLFPLVPRTVVWQYLGVTQTLNLFEGLLEPPPPQDPEVIQPSAWYLPPWNQLSDPASQKKVVKKKAPTNPSSSGSISGSSSVSSGR